MRPIDVYSDPKLQKQADEKLTKSRNQMATNSEKRNGQEPLKIGDKVRVRSDVHPNVRKNNMLKKRKYLPTWSNSVYSVVKIFKPRKESSVYQYMVSEYNRKFVRSQLQKVVGNSNHLDNNTVQRPQYSESWFNREEHIKELGSKRRRLE